MVHRSELCCIAEQSDRDETASPVARPISTPRNSGPPAEIARHHNPRSISIILSEDSSDGALERSVLPLCRRSSKLFGQAVNGHRLPRPSSFQALIQKGLKRLPSGPKLRRSEPQLSKRASSPAQNCHQSLLNISPYDSDAREYHSIVRKINESNSGSHSRISIHSIQWNDPYSVQNAQNTGEHLISTGLTRILTNEDPTTSPRDHLVSPKQLTPLSNKEIERASTQTRHFSSFSQSGNIPERTSSTLIHSSEPIGEVQSPGSLKTEVDPQNSNVTTRAGHHRLSSSGMASHKIPSSWGNVLSASTSTCSMRRPSNATEVFENAMLAAQEERSAFLLPEKRDKHLVAPLFRERSSSYCRPREPSIAIDPLQKEGPRQSVSLYHLRTAGSIRSLNDSAMPAGVNENMEAARAYMASDVTENSTAWGRYPSHNRESRTGSASSRDKISTIDFATRMPPQTESNTLRRGGSLPASFRARSSWRQSRQNSRASKGRSASFGSTFLRNWSGLFRSQSKEFMQYGHGHRTSVTTGGVLEYPELEVLAPVFSTYQEPKRIAKRSIGDIEMYTLSKMNGESSLSKDDNDRTVKAQRRDSRAQVDGFEDIKVPGSGNWASVYEECVRVPTFSSSETLTNLPLGRSTTCV